MNPNMNSGMTKINPGNCATRDWRNQFNLVTTGNKVVWRTNAQLMPWIQLDMRKDVRIIKVKFESGPIGAQNVEIRVTNSTVPGSKMINTMLTDDGTEVCGGSGTTIDGVTVMEVCCKLQGRFVTIQGTDSANQLPLEVSEIRITAAGEGCADPDESLANPSS